MLKRWLAGMFLLGSIGLISGCELQSDPAVQIVQGEALKLSLLCKPTADKVPAARKINVLFLDGKRLYIGHGDYVINTGPTDILSYDLVSGKLTKEGVVDDEAIVRYRRLGDQLVIPGVDATEDWSFGNVYFRQGESWVKRRTLPRSVHVFDIAECDGRWFVGVHYATDFGNPKADPGLGIVFSSGDQGKTWQMEYVVGADGNTNTFVRFLIKYQGKLYAFASSNSGEAQVPVFDAFGGRETLIYDGDSTWRQLDLIPSIGVQRVIPFPAGDKVGLWAMLKPNGKIPAAKLYAFDGKSAVPTDYPGGRFVNSISYQGQAMLLVERDGRYLVERTPDLVHWAQYTIPAVNGQPLSLEYDGKFVYVGTSDGSIYKGELK